MVVPRVAAAVICAAVVAGLEATAAHAEPIGDPGMTTTIGPTTSGPTVSQGTAGFDPVGTRATSGSTTTVAVTSPAQPTPGGNSGAALTYVPVQNGVAPGGGSAALLVSCPPGTTAYAVYDAAGNFQGVFCATGQQPPAGPVPSPLQLAELASARQPWPSLRVSTNPDIGLTGLASWFWCAGSASMPDATASAGALAVVVRSTLAGVQWDFGDGNRSAGDLGQAFPVPSDVQHVYQTDTFGIAAGYTITATVRWTVSYSVNGGPFTVLGIKTRNYSHSYVVDQLQPQAVSVT